MISLLMIFIMISLFLGAYPLTISDLFQGNQEAINIFLKFRLPRTISVILTGVALSISGAIMQSITNNKFVSPTTIGTMDFSRLGITISLIMSTGASIFLKSIIAFIISFFGSLFFIFIIQKLKFKDKIMIPLIGIMLGTLVSGFTVFIGYYFNLSQIISSWLEGGFSHIYEGRYEILYLIIPATIISYIFASKFLIIGLGEEFSKNIGVNYKLFNIIGLLICSLVVSLIIVTVGGISFVGLIIPNIVSLIKGDNLKKNLFNIALTGGVFLLFCDILARLIRFPYEIPISLITSIIGGILFVFLIFFKRKKVK